MNPIKNIFFYSLTDGLVKLLPLCFIPLILLQSSLEYFGEYALLVSWVNIFSMIIGLEIKKIYERDLRTSLSQALVSISLFSRAVVVQLFLVLILISIEFLFFPTVVENTILVYTTALLTSFRSIVLTHLRASFDIARNAFSELSYLLAFYTIFCSALYLLGPNFKIEYLYASAVVGGCISSCLFVPKRFLHLVLVSFRIKTSYRDIFQHLPLYLVGVRSVLVNNLDKSMATILFSTEVAALLSLSVTYTNPIKLISNSVLKAIRPYLYGQDKLVKNFNLGTLYKVLNALGCIIYFLIFSYVGVLLDLGIFFIWCGSLYIISNFARNLSQLNMVRLIQRANVHIYYRETCYVGLSFASICLLLYLLQKQYMLPLLITIPTFVSMLYTQGQLSESNG